MRLRDTENHQRNANQGQCCHRDKHLGKARLLQDKPTDPVTDGCRKACRHAKARLLGPATVFFGTVIYKGYSHGPDDAVIQPVHRLDSRCPLWRRGEDIAQQAEWECDKRHDECRPTTKAVRDPPNQNHHDDFGDDASDKKRCQPAWLGMEPLGDVQGQVAGHTIKGGLVKEKCE